MKALGIIKVKAGLGGGYVLGRSASSITLWDIYLSMRKDNPFKLKAGSNKDSITNGLPAALEETFADTEYAMKKPLGNTTVRQISSKISALELAV